MGIANLFTRRAVFMMRLHRFLFAILVLGIMLAVSQRSDAQTIRQIGRKQGPANGRAPVVTTIPGSATIPTQNPYNLSNQYSLPPQYSYPASNGGTAAPNYWNSAPVTNNYYYYSAPTFVPFVPDGGGIGFIPSTFFFTTGWVPNTIMPRAKDETPPPEASIEILMPNNEAALLVDGAKTSTDGLRRRFTSPPLEPGNYTYHLTASWMRDGEEIRMERRIRVSPGGKYFVDFNKIESASNGAK
jgi:uncharacterized protein (TIGR03000 family)